MILCSFLGILYMCQEKEYTYIIFPLAIIVGASFSFYDANDREYLIREGYDPDDFSVLFPYDEYSVDKQNNTAYKQTTYDHTRYAPKTSYTNNKKEYEALTPKCKRNFKITVNRE